MPGSLRKSRWKMPWMRRRDWALNLRDGIRAVRSIDLVSRSRHDDEGRCRLYLSVFAPGGLRPTSKAKRGELGQPVQRQGPDRLDAKDQGLRAGRELWQYVS